MSQTRLPGVTAVLAGLICLAACSSAVSQPATANTVPAPTTSAATATSAVPPASPTGAENLTLTDAIRTQLVAAAAKAIGLPASDYAGLAPGKSYYGFDPATNAYWAGGALAPSPSSQRAMVSVQDNGAYYVFEEPAGGSWTAFPVGLGGIAGTPCAARIPAALAALWQWPAGACHPAKI